jgi:hypothetical protein
MRLSIWIALGLVSTVAVGCAESEPAQTVSVGEERDSGMRDSFRGGVPRPTGSGSSANEASDDGAQAGESCNLDADCKPGTTCFQGTCVGEGELRFSLSWTLDTDLDLHVMTPGGEEIYFANPTAVGGELDVDDCVGSTCREPGGTHVENVYWGAGPPTGEYTFWAHNFSQEFLASFEIEVSRDGRTITTERGQVPLTDPYESTRFTYTF